MLQRHVPVTVAVLDCARRTIMIMIVGVVSLTMVVCMLVRFVFLHVRTAVAFSQMQNDARSHQHCTGQHPRAAASLAQQERKHRADERREGEHRTGARRAESTLRQQVATRAEAVAGGAHRQQGERWPQSRQALADTEGTVVAAAPSAPLSITT